MSLKLVILDRDGVINFDSDAYIKTAAEWQAIPGSLEAIAKLQQHGYTVAVATNQSGLARGLFNPAALAQIHAKFRTLLSAAGGKPVTIAYCPHAPEDQCACRKPKPGLLLQLAQKYCADLSQTWVIGDARRDLEAAWNVGARPLLVLTGKGQITQKELAADGKAVPVFPNLAQACDALISGFIE
jgi:D-glycero-D-manno-heptose 1,7-bisphosphate phosphatase